MDPVTIVGLVASAVELAKLACSLLSNCFGCYKNIVDSRARAEALRSEVLQLVAIIEGVQAMVEGIDLSSVRVPLIRSEFKRTFELLNEAKDYTKDTNRYHAMKWSLKKAETDRLIEKIRTQKSSLGLLLAGHSQYKRLAILV